MATQVLTAKDYMQIFQRSYATAKRWLSADRKALGTQRVTVAAFCARNGFQLSDLPAYLRKGS